jgi:hypothetical protein
MPRRGDTRTLRRLVDEAGEVLERSRQVVEGQPVSAAAPTAQTQRPVADQSVIAGGCYCGQVRYRAAGAPIFQAACHCANCRRASGAQSVAWVTFPEAAFTLTQGEPVRYPSETGATWSFCGRCGTTLTYTNGSRPGEIDVTTGSLDDPEAFPPKLDVNGDEKLSWVAPCATCAPSAAAVARE